MKRGYLVPGPGEPFDPNVFKLGKPCARNHLWDEGVTLRLISSRKCPICDRIDSRERKAAKMQDSEYRAKHAAYVRERRQRLGRPSRSKHGLPYTPRPDDVTLAIRKSIKNAGNLPSVAELVYKQQLSYWQANPEARREYNKKYQRRYNAWLYMVDPHYRLYHRQKSKRRKALIRDSVGIQLTGKQVQRRFAEFEHRCAYCGAAGDLHIEHVVPISKGGTHALGNIVPACKDCNYSKRDSDVEAWYRAQSFFSDQRWRKIRRVLGWSGSSTGQLALL